MARTTGEEAQRNAFHRMGRNDFDKLGYPHWLGAIGSDEEKEYMEGFNERKEEVINNA